MQMTHTTKTRNQLRESYGEEEAEEEEEADELDELGELFDITNQ